MKAALARIGRWFAWLLLAVFAVFATVQMWYFGHILYWKKNNPASTSFIDARIDAQRTKNPQAKISHIWVEYPAISVNLKRAIIAAEDDKFIDHEGFDWDGIQKAYEKNMRKKKIVAGGSTISQQLAKNLFLSTKRTPWRKVEEVIITVMLESVMSKQRIFEIYLNVIEWGNGVFGAEAAAQYYYHVSAAQLSAPDAARLAAMVPNPRYYDQHREARGMLRKTEIILQRMADAEIP